MEWHFILLKGIYMSENEGSKCSYEAGKKLNYPQLETKHLQPTGSLCSTFTQTFVEMIFQGTGLELFSFCLERKGYSLDMKRKLMSHSE